MYVHMKWCNLYKWWWTKYSELESGFYIASALFLSVPPTSTHVLSRWISFVSLSPRTLNVILFVQVVWPLQKWDGAVTEQICDVTFLMFRGNYWNLAERYTDMVKTVRSYHSLATGVCFFLFLTIFPLLYIYNIKGVCGNVLLRYYSNRTDYHRCSHDGEHKLGTSACSRCHSTHIHWSS